MGFTVRELLPRIFAMRPDLDPGMIERNTQEAAKQVMRETFLGRVVQTVFPLKGGTNQILLTPQVAYWNSVTGKPFWVDYTNSSVEDNTMIFPASMSGSSPDVLTGVDPNPFQKTPCDILRIIRVRRIQLPAEPPATFKGMWTAQDGNLDPASYSQGDFVIVFGSFVLQTPEGFLYNVKSGDVIQLDSAGTGWNQYPLELYDTMQQVNGPTMDFYTNRSKSPAGSNGYYLGVAGAPLPLNTVTVQWSQRNGQLGILTEFGDTTNNLDLVRVQGDIWVTQTGNPGFVPMPASQYYTGPTYAGSPANLKITWTGPAGDFPATFSTVEPVNEGHFDLYLSPGSYSAPVEDTTLAIPVPTANTLVVSKPTNTARLYYDLPINPTFTIAVTPDVGELLIDNFGNQVDPPLAFNAVITRIDGYADAITVVFGSGNDTAFSADGFSATMGGLGSATLVDAPDTFTISASGTSQGWGHVISEWQGIQLTATGADAQVALSNVFTVNETIQP